jgi:thioredoxin-dependent peroxiredoxin
MNKTLRRLLLAFGLGTLCGLAQAADLKVGDSAPDFALTGSDGKVHRLADYRGKAVVLAWYPKAFTGG